MPEARPGLADRALAASLVWFLLLTWAVGVVIVIITLAGVDADNSSVPWWTVAVAVAVIGGTGIPLHHWLRPAVEAVLFSHPEDAHDLIAQVGRRFGDASPEAAGDLPTEIAGQIARRLRLPYVAIVVGGDASPDDAPADVTAVPLSFTGEPVGTLLVSPRPREKALSAQDLALLHELATHVGIALHAVRVSADLRASRAAVITAREEERRRIRRDLHDGLGPTLASLKLHLAAVQQLLPDQPARARAVVDQLRVEVRGTSAHIRELVYDLRPPMLDEFGLLGAIRSRAADLHGVAVTLDAPEPLPELPAAAEVALYRIASEALANVARHAAAHTCCVTISVEPAWLRLTVVDDGRGLPAALLEGVGLAAMRERAQELDGALSVTTGPEGGTLVTASLPRANPGARSEPTGAVVSARSAPTGSPVSAPDEGDER